MVRIWKENNWVLHSVSLVSQCPTCGTSNWSKPLVMQNGKTCTHPTRIIFTETCKKD